jgi:hypothetical protein
MAIFKHCSFTNPLDMNILHTIDVPFDPPVKWINAGECEFENDYGQPEVQCLFNIRAIELGF